MSDRWIRRLRRTAELGPLAMVHDRCRFFPTLSAEGRWEVWEVDRRDGEDRLAWLISSGATPRAAYRNALRRLRADRIRGHDDG